MVALRSLLWSSAAGLMLVASAAYAAADGSYEIAADDVSFNELAPAAGTIVEVTDATEMVAEAPAEPVKEQAAPLVVKEEKKAAGEEKQAPPSPAVKPVASNPSDERDASPASPAAAAVEAAKAGINPAEDADANPASAPTMTATVFAAEAAATGTASAYPVKPAGSPVLGGQRSLEEVVELAIKHNPERSIADAQVLQAEAAVDEARANYFPQANIKSEYGFEYNDPFAVAQGATTFPADNMALSMSGNLRQMLYDGFLTAETVRQRMQLVESSKLSKNKVTEELIKTTVEVYMELYQFQQVVRAGDENLGALKEIARIVDLSVEAGDASKAEQNYVKARVAAAEQNLITAKQALKDAKAALVYLVGDVGEFDALPPPLEAYSVGGREEIIDRALMASTEMRLIQSDLMAAGHELKSTEGRFKPELAFVMDGNRAIDAGGQTGTRDFASAKLQMTYRLLDGGLRKATSERQYAKLRELENRILRAKRDITQRVTRDINKQQAANAELEVTKREIETNIELEDLYRKQFKQGDIDITNLVESQERIYAGRAKKAKLESDLVNVTFSLLRSAAGVVPRFCSGVAGC